MGADPSGLSHKLQLLVRHCLGQVSCGLTLSGLELFVAMRGHLLELLCTSKFSFDLVAPSNLGLGSLLGLL